MVLLQQPLPGRRTLAAKYHLLEQFEGRSCLWRVPASLSLWLLTRGVPVFAAVFVAVTVFGSPAMKAAVGTVLALIFEQTARWLRARFPWQGPIDRRLASYEAPNYSAMVDVVLAEADRDRAVRSLRAAKFNPATGRRLSSPPVDAPELNALLQVHEPAAWTQSTSNSDRVDRITTALRAGQIRARVGGIDVHPGEHPGAGRGDARARD